MTFASAHPSPHSGDLSEMDNAKISAHHWKIMFISGIG